MQIKEKLSRKAAFRSVHWQFCELTEEREHIFSHIRCGMNHQLWLDIALQLCTFSTV
jgi:hypothetical protein